MCPKTTLLPLWPRYEERLDIPGRMIWWYPPRPAERERERERDRETESESKSELLQDDKDSENPEKHNPERMETCLHNLLKLQKTDK